MNKKERHAISRVYNALSSIAFPASGTQSVTVRGLAEFSRDMRVILPKAMNVLVTVCGESYPGELNDDVANLADAVRHVDNMNAAEAEKEAKS